MCDSDISLCAVYCCDRVCISCDRCCYCYICVYAVFVIAMRFFRSVSATVVLLLLCVQLAWCLIVVLVMVGVFGHGV